MGRAFLWPRRPASRGTSFPRKSPLRMPRPLLFVAPLLFTCLIAQAETPPLLAEAFRQFMADQNRWAYTETRSSQDKKGQPRRDQVTVIDPSLDYARQLVPEIVDGQPATPAQVTEWTRRNEE